MGDGCHLHISTVVSSGMQEQLAPMNEMWNSSDRYNSTNVNVAPKRHPFVVPFRPYGIVVDHALVLPDSNPSENTSRGSVTGTVDSNENSSCPPRAVALVKDSGAAT